MITSDFYGICETAVIELLQNTAAFGWKDKSKQVTKADDTFLDKGFDSYAITYPGAFPQANIGGELLEVQWEIMIDVLVRWDSTEKKAWSDFRAHRSKVFNLFNVSYEGRDLNRTPSIKSPRGVVLNSNDRPRYIPLNRDPESDIVSHIGQVMVLTVTQVIDKEY